MARRKINKTTKAGRDFNDFHRRGQPIGDDTFRQGRANYGPGTPPPKRATKQIAGKGRVNTDT